MRFLQFLALIGTLTITAAIQAPNAFADDETEGGGVTFVTSIGYQDKLLTFDQTYKGPAPADNSYADFSVHLPIANVSFTASMSRVFLALKYERSLTESTTGADETNRQLLFGDANLLTFEGSQLGATREDQSITLGYNVFKSFNLFIGYMKGQTTLTPDPIINYVTLQFNKAYLIHDERANGRDIPRYEQTYIEQGPYVGVSYAWKIADAGTLSTSIAYADLDGDYEDNADCVINTCDAFDWEGKSNGTSLGLTWTAPLGESSSYFLDLRRQAYKMDGEDKTGLFPGQTVETEETMQGITAGIQHYF